MATRLGQSALHRKRSRPVFHRRPQGSINPGAGYDERGGIVLSIGSIVDESSAIAATDKAAGKYPCIKDPERKYRHYVETESARRRNTGT